MIQANELRIGNYVWDDYGGIMIVSQIGDGFVDCKKENHLPSGRYDLDSIKPIKLNDEWFISCQSNSIFNNGFTYRKTNTGRYDIFCGSVFITVIEFVHELQNLNFALLGEELIFNKEYL